MEGGPGARTRIVGRAVVAVRTTGKIRSEMCSHNVTVVVFRSNRSRVTGVHDQHWSFRYKSSIKLSRPWYFFGRVKFASIAFVGFSHDPCAQFDLREVIRSRTHTARVMMSRFAHDDRTRRTSLRFAAAIGLRVEPFPNTTAITVRFQRRGFAVSLQRRPWLSV